MIFSDLGFETVAGAYLLLSSLLVLLLLHNLQLLMDCGRGLHLPHGVVVVLVGAAAAVESGELVHQGVIPVHIGRIKDIQVIAVDGRWHRCRRGRGEAADRASWASPGVGRGQRRIGASLARRVDAKASLKSEKRKTGQVYLTLGYNRYNKKSS